MAAGRTPAMASMPAATVVRPRPVVIAPSSEVVYPALPVGLSIGCGVGSSRWTNALAVDTKAMTAFGHGPCRLLERSP